MAAFAQLERVALGVIVVARGGSNRRPSDFQSSPFLQVTALYVLRVPHVVPQPTPQGQAGVRTD